MKYNEYFPSAPRTWRLGVSQNLYTPRNGSKLIHTGTPHTQTDTFSPRLIFSAVRSLIFHVANVIIFLLPHTSPAMAFHYDTCLTFTQQK